MAAAATTTSPMNTTRVDNEAENTEIWSGAEEVVLKALQSFPKIKSRYDQCIDISGPSIIMITEPIVTGFIDLKSRGIKLRILTDITKDNLEYCKKLMPIVSEIRHLDGIKGNFAVTEREYVATAVIRQAKPLTQLVHSTVKALVEQQQYFFDMLWSKAIPARQRIREIEQGEKREFEEMIREPSEIRQIQGELLESSQYEIMMIFPTVNEFYRELLQVHDRQYNDNQQRQEPQQTASSLLELLKEAAKNRGVNIRILVYSDPYYYHHQSSIQGLLQEAQKFPIQIRIISNKQDHKEEKHLQTKLITLIVDNELSITIDLKEKINGINKNNNIHDYDDDDDQVGLATYTNSEARIETFSSMFEILWIQSEKK